MRFHWRRTGHGSRHFSSKATLSSRFAGWSYGVGIGYDRRKLLVPRLSPIANLNGITDESYYLFLSAARQLDADSDLSVSGYINYFDNGAPGASDVGVSAHVIPDAGQQRCVDSL